jgi:hypothetical protein
VLGIIESHKSHSAIERRQWDEHLRWYQSRYSAGETEPIPTGGTDDDDGADLTLETNYPYAYTDTMVSNICPTNPKITVTALRSVNAPRARFREALVNYSLYHLGAHKNLWKQATEASMYGRGFTKIVWNKRRNRAEISNVDPRYLFYDLAASTWEDIRYICEVTVVTKEEFERRNALRVREDTNSQSPRAKTRPLYDPEVAKKVSSSTYPQWLRDTTTDKTIANKAAWDVFDWVVIYEFYDLISEEFFHFADGVNEPLLRGPLPYRFVPNPFVPLWFNDNLVDLGGLSDVQLISGPLQRLNEIDTLELQFAQASIPFPVLNEGLCEDAESARNQILNASGPYALVTLSGLENAPVDHILRWSTTPGLNPSFQNMRARTINIIEFILGLPQYQRGVAGATEIATEIALIETALRTRNGRRMKAVNDVLQTWAVKIVGLYEEYLHPETTLPLRLADSKEVLEATREELGFRGPQDFENPGDGPMEWDYEALPYSPAENNRLVQLQNVMQNLPMILNLPGVDIAKLTAKVLDLLQIRDVLAPEGAPGATPAMQPGADPGMPPGGGPQQVDENGLPNVLAGELPPGAEPPAGPMPFGGPGARGQQAAAQALAGHEGGPLGGGM